MKTIATTRLLAAIAEQPHDGPAASLPRITNAAGPRASIYLYDSVGKWTAANAKDFQRQLSAIKAPAIDLHINSPGGSVFEGLAIFNLLRAHPAKVTTHIDGLAASIASVIALAGDEIEITEGGQFMIHDASVATAGNARELRKDADLVEQISESITDIYASRTGRPRAEIRAEMEAETWFNAAAAVTAKFANRVVRAPRVAAQWEPDDHLHLPAEARALAAAAPPSLPKNPTARDMAAELDRLRSENLSLQSQLTTAAKPAVAPKPTTPTMTVSTPAKPAAPTKFAATPDAAVIEAALAAATAAPDREAAIVELNSRGFTAAPGAVTISREAYGLISAEARAAFSAAGGKIADPTAGKPDFSHLHGMERTMAAVQWEQSKNPTATEKSASLDYTFPHETKNPRTAQQFLALGEIARANIIIECEDERNGRTLRQELYDAHASAEAVWKPGATFSPLGFKQSFARAFNAIYKYGPECATWEDPAPPVSPNAMDAQAWLQLTPAQIETMNSHIFAKDLGRNTRAELKRAYRDGSPAERAALKGIFHGLFKSPFAMYPSELI